jgi:predicted amidohydrolase
MGPEWIGDDLSAWSGEGRSCTDAGGTSGSRNRETICSLLRRAAPGDWVVFPRGALTGYFPGERDYLADTGRENVEAALERLRAVVARQGCHCLVGTARFVVDEWRNSAVLLSPGGEVRRYDKNVLNPFDSRHFVASDELCVWEVDGVKVGVQICWELLFPQPWAQLKRDGAQIVFHLNNAVKPKDAFCSGARLKTATSSPAPTTPRPPDAALVSDRSLG